MTVTNQAQLTFLDINTIRIIRLVGETRKHTSNTPQPATSVTEQHGSQRWPIFWTHDNSTPTEGQVVTFSKLNHFCQQNESNSQSFS